MKETAVSAQGVRTRLLYRWKEVPVLVWILGALAGLSLASHTFQGEFLLNWDQVIGPDIPVPPGVWGLGPELPRRTPFYLPLALVSRLIGGPQTVGLLLVGLTTLAVAGAASLARPDGAGVGPGTVDLSSALVGLAYGLSPFLLSRAAVGHLPLVAATAFLPWLLHEIDSRSRRNLIRWAAAFGLLGSSGAVLGLIPIGLALIRGHSTSDRASSGDNQPVRWWFRTGGLLLLSQAAWIAPGAVAVLAGVPLPASTSTAFDLRHSGSGGLSRVFAGGGLFLEQEDVAYRAGTIAAIFGLVLLCAGVIGLRERKARQGTDVLLLGAMGGAALVFVSATPGLSQGWHGLVSIGPLGVLRESHKFWPLMGLGLLVGLATVLRRFCGDVLVVIGVATVALVLGAGWPGLFGADGRLEAVDASEQWQPLHAAVDDDPGRMAVFPWRRYDELGLAEGRTVLQPAPWILPGVVLISGDVGNATASVERQEMLQEELAELDRRIRAGQGIAPDLVAQDIQWLLVMANQEADFYQRLGQEPAATPVLDTPEFQLYRLTTREDLVHWSGLPLPVRIIPSSLDGSVESSPTSTLTGTAIWDRSCEWGWLMNWQPLPRDEGRCLIDSGGGILWYPPAFAAVFGLVSTLTLLAFPVSTVSARPRRVGNV